MSISVCIPTYNASAYLREAIESALAQTRAPDEIIVVDDGSTDDTAEVCASFGTQVRYIYQENDHTIGAGARAHAMREAKGEWLALLDHDDRWLPTKLEKQLQAAESYPDACAVFTKIRTIDAKGERVDELKEPESSGEVIRIAARDAFHLLLRLENSYCPSSALIRRSFFVEHGVTDPASVACPDYDLWLCITRRYPVVFIDERLTEYRMFAEQFTSDGQRFAEVITRTLDAQREHLHPNCESCRESFRMGRAHVDGMSARALLDQYHTAARAGELRRAIPLFWSALRTSPGEVFRPRRLMAATKNAALALFRENGSAA